MVGRSGRRVEHSAHCNGRTGPGAISEKEKNVGEYGRITQWLARPFGKVLKRDRGLRADWPVGDGRLVGSRVERCVNESNRADARFGRELRAPFGSRFTHPA